MFISYLKATDSYQIIYKNIYTGKRNRKDTKTADIKEAERIFKEFQVVYNKQIEIHNTQIQNNSNANNLVLVEEAKTNAEDGELTLKDSIKIILNYYNNQNGNNIDVQQNIKRNYAYLIEICGNKKLSEYKLIDFEKYKTERLKQVSPGSVNCELRNLKAYFNRLIDFEYLLKNPMSKIKFVDNFNKRLEFTKTEMKYIIQETEKIKDDLMYYVINIAYYTGVRLSELINLKWEDINLDEGIIYIVNKISEGFLTKSRKERFIPICKELKLILLKLKKYDSHNTYVICKSNGYKYTSDFISLQFRTLLKRLKIKDKNKSFHSLRHSFAMLYLEKGGNIFNLQQILGHSKITTTTDYYLHRNKQNMIDEINKLNLVI